MGLSVLGLVLLTAIIHALWNAWLKVSGDRLAALAVMAVGWALVALLALPFIEAPAPAARPFLAGSTVVHTIYALVLIRAYRFTGLSVAYPIARGIGPLLVMAAATVIGNDQLGVTGAAAVLLIAAGVMWLGGTAPIRDQHGLLLSLATGGLVGAYTLLDGLGGRADATPHSYSVWLLLLTAVPLVLVAWAAHGSALLALARPLCAKGLSAGVLSAGAYWIIIWAMSVAPMGLVAAVRESSVVFAAVIGSTLLGESVRWSAVLLVFAGIVLARLA
jgi:drug/metabolite transporter (DMT)-like permease